MTNSSFLSFDRGLCSIPRYSANLLAINTDTVMMMIIISISQWVLIESILK